MKYLVSWGNSLRIRCRWEFMDVLEDLEYFKRSRWTFGETSRSIHGGGSEKIVCRTGESVLDDEEGHRIRYGEVWCLI